jgi:hypothetical protein
VLVGPAAGLGDTTPIPFSASVPGADPSHSSALELLASRIASHIAGRPVVIRCAGGAGSTAVSRHIGGTTELAPEICWPLQQFAETATKPSGRSLGSRAPAYWAAYDLDAVAILTLAQESVHLSGVVDSARAVCLGMDWMPYVAEQLGASPDGAQVIARWFRDKDYPLARGSHAGPGSAACSTAP